MLIYQLGAQWSVYDQYNYGWAVPFLCAYSFWQRVKDMPRITDRKPTTHGTTPYPGLISTLPEYLLRTSSTFSPSNAEKGSRGGERTGLALAVVAAAGLLFLPTRFLHEANPIWRLTSLLWTLEVIALTLGGLYLLGGARWLRHFAFPVAFFLVAVPWPSGAERVLVETLTSLNVATTIELLNTFGIPAIQHGNVIEITSGVVGVDEACSGIRSFQATLMISLFFGEVYRLTVVRRIVLCLLGFALSFVFNVGRTFLLTYVASNQGVPAIEKWHDPAGVTILVCCFVALWFTALVLKREGKARLPGKGAGETSNIEYRTSNLEGGTIPHPTLSPIEAERVTITDSEVVECGDSSPVSSLGDSSPSPRHAAAVNSAGKSAHCKATARSSEFKIQSSAFDVPPPFRSTLNSLPSTFRKLAFGLAAWLVLVEVGVQVWYRSHEQAAGSNANWTLRIGDLDPSFRKIEISPMVLRQFNADESTELRWQDGGGATWQLYYFRWHPAHSLRKRVNVQLAKTHGPEKCLPAAGIKVKSYLGMITVPVAGLNLALQHYLFEAQGRPLHVFYAIYEDPTGTEELANRRRDFGSRLAAARAGSRNYGQRFLELAVWGISDPQQATAVLQRQLEKVIQFEPTVGGP